MLIKIEQQTKTPQIMFATMQILGPASSWKLEPEMFLYLALENTQLINR